MEKKRLFSDLNLVSRGSKLSKWPIASISFHDVPPKPATRFRLETSVQISGSLKVNLIIDNPDDPEIKCSRIVFKDQMPSVFIPNGAAAVDFRVCLEALQHHKDLELFGHIAAEILAGLMKFEVSKTEGEKAGLEFRAGMKNIFSVTEVVKYDSVERFFIL